MKKTVFVSDVHLKAIAEDRDRHLEFAAFLRQFKDGRCERLVCLGDLFDFWFEYRHVAFSDYFQVLRAFAELQEAGVELHLVCGNHDFWGGRFLREELGFHIHDNSFLLELGGKRVYMVHGDGVNKQDHVYRVYKRIARNPLIIKCFRMLHPDWAMALALWVSGTSRKMGAVEDPAEGPEVHPLSLYAEELLARGEADVVLCGHAHAVAWEEHPTPEGTGLYINPGDWLHKRSYLVFEGGAFHLHSETGEDLLVVS